MTNGTFGTYLAELHRLSNQALFLDSNGHQLEANTAIRTVIDYAEAAHESGNHIFFIGNGGSAAIASHMANDFTKNGNLRSLVLNDSALLTCHANDFGYEHVYSKSIEFHCRPGDMLFAISSSGRSPNILNAVSAAHERGMKTVTLSGFDQNNPLRESGDINIYVDSHEYGFVEVGHQAILHAILDISMGWGMS